MHPRFLGKMMRDAVTRFDLRPHGFAAQSPASGGNNVRAFPTDSLIRQDADFLVAFYSNAFRVLDERSFVLDPGVEEMSRHLEFFEGHQDGEILRCITHKTGQPQMALRWDKHSVAVMADDVLPSTLNISDICPWVETLQKHLHPDDGIIVSGVSQDGTRYHIFITTRKVAVAEL
jgi:hypothetical protein